MDSVCRNCRREGVKLFLKGEKCFTAKCPVSRRSYPPGVHGPKGAGKLTEYGTQLREKQKAKRVYGVRERQFRNTVEQALAKTGNTAEHLLKALEMRLDSVVRRAGYAVSQRQARQLVSHGHFLVNGKPVTVASFVLGPGDAVTVSDSPALGNEQNVLAANLAREQKSSPPPWLAVDTAQRSVSVLRLPEIKEVDAIFDSKLIIQFYSR